MHASRWAGLAVATVVVLALVLVAWRWSDRGSPARGDLDDVADLTAQEPAIVAMYHHIESHPGMAQHLPCYCGCGELGHQNLFDCFVIKPGVYSGHALGCKICRDEATDAARLAGDGQDVRAIREWIDREYSKYGPGTNTP